MVTATGHLIGPPKLDANERELDLLESSWADFAHAIRTGVMFIRDGTAVEKLDALGLLGIRTQFDAYRKRHDEGDGTALLEALQFACSLPVPIPYWLALELRRRCFRVWQEAVTLHEAMGLEAAFPSRGKKAGTARKELLLRKKLYLMVAELMHPPAASDGSQPAPLPLEAALRRLKAEGRLHIGLTKARDLFNEQHRIQRAHLGKIGKEPRRKPRK